MKAEVPYDQLPGIPPPDVELETKKILKRCIEARSALASLKQAAERIPYQGVLINVIPMLEAQSSTEIENIVTTSDELFRGEARDSELSDPNVKEAINYRSALLTGFQELDNKPICTATAEAICSKIKNVDMRVRTVPGTKLVNDRTGVTIYTPPVGESLLRDKLKNWEDFLHQSDLDLDPLVRLAVGHYQFEAIHPFTDGNGRTGRILNLLYLIDQGLLQQPILYHSRGILDRKAEYYRLLHQVTSDENWEDWILFILEIIQEAAEWTAHKILGIIDLQQHTQDYLRQKHPSAYHLDIMDLIFSLPYCRIANVVERGIMKRQSAARYLNLLVEAGVLEESKMGREKLFIHRNFCNLLYQTPNDFDPYT